MCWEGKDRADGLRIRPRGSRKSPNTAGAGLPGPRTDGARGWSGMSGAAGIGGQLRIWREKGRLCCGPGAGIQAKKSSGQNWARGSPTLPRACWCPL